MQSEFAYDNVEEMEKCRVEAVVELEKLRKKYGFVIFHLMEEMRTKDMTPAQRRQYHIRYCRGGSSF